MKSSISSETDPNSHFTIFKMAFTTKQYDICSQILCELKGLVTQEQEKDVREKPPLPPVNAVMNSSSSPNSELPCQLTAFYDAFTTKEYNTCQKILSDLEGLVAREKDKDLRDPEVVEPIVHELNFQNAQHSQEAVSPKGFVALDQLDLNFNGFDGLEFPLSNIADLKEQSEGADAAPIQIPWDIGGVDFENGYNPEIEIDIPDLVEEEGGDGLEEEGGDEMEEEGGDGLEEEGGDEMEEEGGDGLEEEGGVEMEEDNEQGEEEDGMLQGQQNQDQHEELPPRVIIPSTRLLEGLETAVTSSSEGTTRSTSDEEWEN